MKKMKDSGIEWIDKIPEDWKIERLKDRFSFGKGLPITKEDLEDQGISVINYGQIHSKENFGTGIQDSLIKYVSNKYLQSNPNSLVQEGDFIFADTSEDVEGCGNCVYVDKQIELFAGYHTIILTSKDKSNNKYFAYLFKTDNWRSQLRSKVFGIKVFSITQKILRNISLIVPNCTEQQAIVDYLDKKCSEIDDVIKGKEEENKLLEEYRKSVIYEAVTKGLNANVEMKDSGIEWIGDIPAHWEIKKMKTIGECFGGLTYSPLDICDGKEGILVLRSSNIKNGKLAFEDNVYVKNVKNLPIVRKGDILICSRNGSKELIGKNAYIDNDYSYSFGAFMMIFRCYDIRETKYIHKVFNSNIFDYYLGSFLTSTINQLTKNNLDNMKIPYCTNYFEQQQIADYLDKKCEEIDNLIKGNNDLIDHLKEYKKSLICEAVTGKIEV